MKIQPAIFGLIVCFLLSSISTPLDARFYGHSSPSQPQVSGCTPSTTITDLDIGNVRASIFINGDMWWDLIGSPHYEIPKGSGKHSLFAGALWFGGRDFAGNLFTAAQMYRQSGSDFWPGPLDTTSCDITPSVCNQYNRHWRITRQEVLDFIGGSPPTAAIQYWPGNGDPALLQAHFLAPFIDVNADGIYNFQDGDYPAYNVTPGSGNCNNYLQGDQTIWWVFNDRGNVHAETGSLGEFGLEIRAQAFAYNSADSVLNNTTFYKYQIIDRSLNTYYACYFGQYTDPDLGYYFDDYVGCDVGRGMGYAYNGDSLDEGVTGYGLFPPAVGIDVLQGPLADSGDGIDNNRNFIIDEPGEDIQMTKFVYFNNDFSITGNPSNAQHYYNYLRGRWKDGSYLTFGGTGYQTPGGDSCEFMYPYDSDTNNWGTQGRPQPWSWSEFQTLPTPSVNAPGDRRFLMSYGPITMSAGEVQYVTTAAIWTRTYANGLMASVDSLKVADDHIQDFYNSCYTSISTGIQSPESELLSSFAFPNPADKQVIIRFESEGIRPIRISVFDTNGELVITGQKPAGKEYKINTSGFKPGIYWYQVGQKDGKGGRGKFIVLH